MPYADLSVQEKNKLKAIEAEPLKKPSESEYRNVRVMLPIVKQGFSGLRVPSTPSGIVIPAHALTYDSINKVK